jgi:hypothetical protein
VGDNRSVRANSQVVGNIIVTGDDNRIHAQVHNRTAADLPPAESVNIADELTAIRAILLCLAQEHSGKIGRALDDAEEEAKKPTPDKHEVGAAVTRALEYAQKSAGFLTQMEKLGPHLAGIVSWLGTAWHHLLPVVGLGRP